MPKYKQKFSHQSLTYTTIRKVLYLAQYIRDDVDQSNKELLKKAIAKKHAEFKKILAKYERLTKFYAALPKKADGQQNPLAQASMEQVYPIMQILIDNGADIYFVNNNRTILDDILYYEISLQYFLNFACRDLFYNLNRVIHNTVEIKDNERLVYKCIDVIKNAGYPKEEITKKINSLIETHLEELKQEVENYLKSALNQIYELGKSGPERDRVIEESLDIKKRLAEYWQYELEEFTAKDLVIEKINWIKKVLNQYEYQIKNYIRLILHVREKPSLDQADILLKKLIENGANIYIINTWGHPLLDQLFSHQIENESDDIVLTDQLLIAVYNRSNNIKQILEPDDLSNKPFAALEKSGYSQQEINKNADALIVREEFLKYWLSSTL